MPPVIVVVTVTVPVRPFAPVIVMVVLPAVAPAVTVNVTAEPVDDGVADSGVTLATAAFEFEIENEPPYALSLTVNVCTWPAAVNEIVVGETTSVPGVGVGEGVGVGVGVGEGVAVGVAVGVGEAVGIGVGEAVDTGVGEAVGTGVGDGVGSGVATGVGLADVVGVAVTGTTIGATAGDEFPPQAETPTAQIADAAKIKRLGDNKYDSTKRASGRNRRQRPIVLDSWREGRHLVSRDDV